MNGSTVQWTFAILDSQKSRSLLKRLITESFDFPKLRTRFEEAVLVPIRHDVLRKFVTYTGYVLQQINRSRIEIDTHSVHTGFNYRAQASLQFSLIDIMLILSDADRFRVCLHQLRQRVLEAARDRNRAAHRHIQLGKLFTRAFGGGIDRGAGLVDDDDKRIQLILRDDGSNKRIGLARGGSVADSNTSHVVLLHQVEKSFFGTFEVLLRFRRIDCLVLQKLSCFVDHRNFASRTLAGIDSHDRNMAGRGRKQQGAKILFENFDSFRLRALPQNGAHFILDRRQKKAFIGIPGRSLQEWRKTGLRITDHLGQKISDDPGVVDVDRKI